MGQSTWVNQSTWVRHKLRKTSFRSKNTEFTPDDNHTLASLSEFDKNICFEKSPECSYEISFVHSEPYRGYNIRQKLLKMAKIRVFLQLCLTKLFLCLQMNSADHCGHFEVRIVGYNLQPQLERKEKVSRTPYIQSNHYDL